MRRSKPCEAVTLGILLLLLLLCACGVTDNELTHNPEETQEKISAVEDADKKTGKVEISGKVRVYGYVGSCYKNGELDGYLHGGYSSANVYLTIDDDQTAVFSFPSMSVSGTIEDDTLTGMWRKPDGKLYPIELYCEVTDDTAVVEDPHNPDEKATYWLLAFDEKTTERKNR